MVIIEISSSDTLTPRELEVASLVALAMNNREIAQALFLTTRAVESHITTIIRKLNLKNRTAICRWYLFNYDFPNRKTG